jgi:subtilisin family serine protease
MKFIALTLLSFLIIPAQASKVCKKHTIKVAVVDTGLDLNDPRFKDHLCKTGHKNFVNDEPIDDFNGHGTFVAGLIEKYAGNTDYCLLIYKYYKESASGHYNLRRELWAFQEAIDNGADIINFSSGGSEFNEVEANIIKSHPKVTFVVAAGNDAVSLDIPGNNFYPASLFYDNIEVVENIDENGALSPSSNYGKRVKNKEMGENVVSYMPGGLTGVMSGTSISAAIFSGKLVDKRSRSCEYRR